MAMSLPRHWIGVIVGVMAMTWLGVASLSHAQNRPPECEPPDVLLVTDFSGSMTLGMDGSQGGRPQKVDVLRQAYRDILTRFDKKIRFGVETYTTSRGPGNTCATQIPDIRIQVPVSANSATRCIAALNSMRASGCTPMLPALQEALKHYRNTVIPQDTIKNRRRFVVLLTDGVPNTGCPGWRTDKDSRACGRYLVQEVLKLRNLQVAGKSYDIKTYVIGFGKIVTGPGGVLSLDPQNLNDMASAGGTGKYFQANDLAQLRKALETIANNAGGKVEVCNGKDDNCDGRVDENIVETCQGACGAGKRVCLNGKLTDCSSPPTAGKEVCNNKDDDCNGIVDDKLTRKCPQTNNCGQAKTAICVKGKWTGCTGAADPKEICDGKDNDCDGEVDEGVYKDCSTKCGKGRQACIQGDWSTCTAPRQGAEICDGKDNDCDGQIDEEVDVAKTCHGKCVGGVCHKKCGGNECPSGYECGVDGLCTEKQCDPQCTGDKTCRFGLCVPNDCSKPGGRCRSNEICRAGKCVKDACIGVSCDQGAFCRDGQCRVSCAKIACPDDRVCQDGQCVPKPCAGVSCPSGQSCYRGKCHAAAGCPQKACSSTQVCINGICVDDLCKGVTCPNQDDQCIDGQCFAKGGAKVRRSDGKIDTVDGGGGGNNNGGGDGGGNNNGGGDDNGNNGRAPTNGCVCSASKGLPSKAPLFLFVIFLAIPFLRRRR